MQDLVLTVSGLCLAAAVYSQLMQKNRFDNAVRLVLGFEIVRIMLDLSEKMLTNIKWS